MPTRVSDVKRCRRCQRGDDHERSGTWIAEQSSGQRSSSRVCKPTVNRTSARRQAHPSRVKLSIQLCSGGSCNTFNRKDHAAASNTKAGTATEYSWKGRCNERQAEASIRDVQAAWQSVHSATRGKEVLQADSETVKKVTNNEEPPSRK